MWINRLREIRKARGMTQFDLAKIADVNPTDISTIETGKRYPYPKWRRKIAEALELPEGEIFPGFAEVKSDGSK